MKKTNLNFGGFYNSQHNELIDSMVVSYFNLDCIVDVLDNLNINYRKIFKAYCINYVEIFNEFIVDTFEINLDLKFIKLDSPKYYNFETDTIEISLTNDDKFIKLFINDDKFIIFANKTSQGDDGFYSFYDGIDALKKEPTILLEYIFNYILDSFYDDAFLDYYDRNNCYELLSNLENFYKEVV